ncbi:uncharacterized protein Z518_08737 [Rhinocladiella mackenziei CBS 650.93]|uniref:Uncharacterized protein n=1 Tax=Rhinocladiella mackenziei CBS 650.93 TaxID=1442369 RepID=A0A0D2J1L6_9EURO|nr:uncharacterized protein Z518_08737 [Rhinocladiella mackenziei CBS 650.93]KIX02795.1 hypothetical protein Z518_08737 [Rhinocladiella mackenziei CBS 650.93]
MPTRMQLETAAADVIGILKDVSEYSDARVAVIGGLALWKYIPNGRTTEDIDFIVNIGNAPQRVKQRLLALPNSPFVQQAQFFYYKTPSGPHIQIDITPQWQSPYMPATAAKLRDLTAGAIPYISATDLVVFKMNSCGLRPQTSKKRTDAADAQALLEKLTVQASLKLTNAQKAIVEPSVDDVVAHGTKTMMWWREHLGLPTSP